ncbi:MAG: YaeQ family protein [Deltaproteobacteria bacterium]|nr:YaeQ family protein [Deltaproteobacteria bacterium]
MALLKIKYVLNHDDLGLYGHEGDVVLNQQGGETPEHVYMKLLSYFMFFHEDLLIEADIGQHYKPDLVRLDGDKPVQWIDCGSTSLKKLEKLCIKNKQTLIDIVKKTNTELYSYRLQAERRLPDISRARFFAFDDGFLESLIPHLKSRHNMSITLTANLEQIYLDVDGEGFSSEIHRGETR